MKERERESDRSRERKQDINNMLSETYPEGSLADGCWYCWHGRSLDRRLQL